MRVGQTAPRTGIGDVTLVDHCLVWGKYSIFKQTQKPAEDSITVPKIPFRLVSVITTHSNRLFRPTLISAAVYHSTRIAFHMFVGIFLLVT